MQCNACVHAWMHYVLIATHCCLHRAQVSGRQRLLLLPPELAFAGLYPFPVAHPYDKCSAVDWEEPETDAWPAAAQVRARARKCVHTALSVHRT